MGIQQARSEYPVYQFSMALCMIIYVRGGFRVTACSNKGRMFGQTFGTADLAVIGLLIVLEGVLSIDNALVLGLLAKRLPKHQQKKALTYGLIGAFVFRFIAIGAAAFLLRWRIVKLFGGGYLLYVALKHLLFEERTTAQAPAGITEEEAREALAERVAAPATGAKHAGFWSTVFVIEMTDIAFAIDSILAAIALVGGMPPGHTGPHPKLWVVVTGGFLGVILMRFAAVLFIRLLERFPRFEVSAYLLVAVIGAKLFADWAANSPEHPHRLNFHSPAAPEFWVFWLLMAACFAFGFWGSKKPAPAEAQIDQRP
jgi:YkoY family integral membrane protein